MNTSPLHNVTLTSTGIASVTQNAESTTTKEAWQDVCMGADKAFSIL